MDDQGNAKTQQKAFEFIGGHFAKDGFELVTRALFQTLAHHVHTEQEQRKTQKQIEHHVDVNAFMRDNSVEIVQKVLHVRIPFPID